jgi:hypothetical protein
VTLSFPEFHTNLIYGSWTLEKSSSPTTTSTTTTITGNGTGNAAISRPPRDVLSSLPARAHVVLRSLQIKIIANVMRKE